MFNLSKPVYTELTASFQRLPEDIPIYCFQDGEDFYIYDSRSRENLLDVVSYFEKIKASQLELAEQARKWFVNLCEACGLEANFELRNFDPFCGEEFYS